LKALPRPQAWSYTRVSTEEQAKLGYSLGAQARTIQEFCESKGLELVKSHVDEGYSGKNLDRPGIKGILAALALDEPPFQHLVILYMDRLSREVEGAAHIVNKLRSRKVKLHVISRPDLDIYSPIFSITGVLEIGMAEYQRKDMLAKQRIALDEAKRLNKHLGRVPLGFELGGDGYLHPDSLGRKAIGILQMNDRVQLSELAEELQLKDFNQAYRVKTSIAQYLKRRSRSNCAIVK
jgi:DNA invertase Pin-like site-specific DNA recombinase